MKHCILEGNELPAFSFVYGGQASQDFLTGWKKEVREEPVAGGMKSHRAWTEPDCGLRVELEVREFAEFPAVEWVMKFENRGQADTPILESILPLDFSLPLEPKERLRVHTANGSLCRMDDFLPRTLEIGPGGKETLQPRGGRSSNGAFPFMNLQRRGGGMLLAIGWSGQWQARFTRDPNSLHLDAGMERTHLRLHPGENIRTPRILALFWEGKEDSTGTNLLRQLLLKHYLPRLDGELVQPPAAQCLQAYYYLTGEAGEKYERVALPKTAQLGAEAYWIDACWYGRSGGWSQEVGNWEVNPSRFPHGLKPISDAAHEAGMKFVLWFEPERARPQAALPAQHPEFFLHCPENTNNLLLNLGMPEARRHLTDLISRLITENGVDIYRQDFNFDPLPYWRAADGPDRIGMTEIRYVEGHYEFWDELRRRHPRVWIDNCASGGRRIDLETLSRSLPLWPSDFPDIGGLAFGLGLHVGDQCINAGLGRWIPFFGGGVWNFTPYGTRSEVLGGFTFGFHIDPADLDGHRSDTILQPNDVLAKGKTLLGDEFPLDAARAAIQEWRSLRRFFTGDFHLLLPLTVSGHDWCAYQLHRPDLDSGFALFFRRHESPFSTMDVCLRGLRPGAKYRVSLSPDYQEAPPRTMTGRKLAKLSVSIPDRPGSLLLRYLPNS
ncbi:MAG: alpha-galactosidase [Planctomycetes bacterium]|nr:alpha-galactosidase [Planctomycetota bacterium]